MKIQERILIYLNKFLLSLFLSHNLKSTTVLYKNENFPKIAVFVKIILKMQSKKNLKEYLYINKILVIRIYK